MSLSDCIGEGLMSFVIGVQYYRGLMSFVIGVQYYGGLMFLVIGVWYLGGSSNWCLVFRMV